MKRPDPSSDRGIALVLLTAVLFVLLGAAAIAVDLSAIRADRAASQKIADNAAASGALAASSGGGQEACEAALGYVLINSPDFSTLDMAECANPVSFAGACDQAVASSVTQHVGRFTVTVKYPVPDGDPLMSSALLGASTQSSSGEDGDPCERVGVEITAVHHGLFAKVFDFNDGPTTVHAVARTTIPDDGGGVPINLLLLDRHGCQAIQVSGNGGIIVDAVIDPDGGGPGVPGLISGVAAVDSDGSTGCSSDGVIDVDGSGSSLRADGPEGCSNQSGSAVVTPTSLIKGLGCGLIQTLAPGVPGCASPPANTPACTPGSGGSNRPKPEPTSLPGQVTRARIDYRYNCWSDYSAPPAGVAWAADPLTTANEQDIPGCTTGTPDHIYELIMSIGQSGMPGGFSRWTAAGYPCDLGSSNPAIVVSGDWWIDCPGGFTVRSPVTINGSVVFDGDVLVTGSTGHLDIHNTIGSPGDATFRDGTLTKEGSGHLTFLYTAVYMSKTSTVSMSGGGGSLTWVAPDSGDFDDLALWSDSPLVHSWAGQANLTMTGVFFTPLATGAYSGTSGQNQTDAQWIADKIVAQGQGQLLIRPAFDRAVDFIQTRRSSLIR
ncbi:MAG: hypothetical protein ACRDZM_15400 [Acidimicrobiia bacterium]